MDTRLHFQHAGLEVPGIKLKLSKIIGSWAKMFLEIIWAVFTAMHLVWDHFVFSRWNAISVRRRMWVRSLTLSTNNKASKIFSKLHSFSSKRESKTLNNFEVDLQPSKYICYSFFCYTKSYQNPKSKSVSCILLQVWEHTSLDIGEEEVSRSVIPL